MGQIIDLTGKIFGRWTVIERASNKGNQTMWKCQCNCKNHTIRDVSGSNLRKGFSKSCGCFKDEQTSKRFKKYNRAEIHNDYVIMYTKQDEPFYVDLEDYDRVKNMFWYKDEHGYLLCNTPNGIVLLHRFIMNACDNTIIDHLGGEFTRHDNRKSNLREGNQTLNNMNRKRQSNNKSGVAGICWVSRDNRWMAQIKIHGKTKYLGEYVNFDDAVKARKEAEKTYFGEWSYDNSQKQYQPPKKGEMINE